MTDDVAREERERKFVFARIKELAENPTLGRFDMVHLKAVHAYLFQDLPEHQPGIIRGDTDEWRKLRELEGHGPSHLVHYVHSGVEVRINAILHDFGGPAALQGQTLQEVAACLAGLYGDLDHAHGFYEGNSRTLREFMRELALAAGYTLDWVHAGIQAESRNTLYVARDVAVLERAWPGLTEERAMATNDRAEYEAWWHLKKLKDLQGRNCLEHIIGEALTPRDIV